MTDAASITVIIASYNAVQTISTTLDSLRKQTVQPHEIIVVDSSYDGTDKLVRRSYPEVDLLHYDTRKYCGSARNLGLKRATCKIIALIDADCSAAPNWIETIVAAHANGHLAVGGTIANANPESFVGWAAYLQEFVRWMPGTPQGKLRDVAAANMSYDKSLFERFGLFLEDTYGSDTDFHWRMAAAGIYIHFDPRIRVSHRNIDKLGVYMTHEFCHGRDFASVRILASNFSFPLRIAYAGAWPLITCKLLIETTHLALRKGIGLKKFARVLPLLLAGITCWSIGEALGYLRPRNTPPRQCGYLSS